MIAVVIPVLSVAAALAGFAASLWMLIVAIFSAQIIRPGNDDTYRTDHNGPLVFLPSAVAPCHWSYWEIRLAKQQFHWVSRSWLSLTAIKPVGILGAAQHCCCLLGLPFSFWAYSIPREPHGRTLSAIVSSDAPQLDSQRSHTRSSFLGIADRCASPRIYWYDDFLPPELSDGAQWLATATVCTVIDLPYLTMTVIFTLISGAVINIIRCESNVAVLSRPIGDCLFLAGGKWAGIKCLCSNGIPRHQLRYFHGRYLDSLWPEIYGTVHLGSIRAIAVSRHSVCHSCWPRAYRNTDRLGNHTTEANELFWRLLLDGDSV